MQDKSFFTAASIPSRGDQPSGHGACHPYFFMGGVFCSGMGKKRNLMMEYDAKLLDGGWHTITIAGFLRIQIRGRLKA